MEEKEEVGVGLAALRFYSQPRKTLDGVFKSLNRTDWRTNPQEI